MHAKGELPAWLLPADECAADVMAAESQPLKYMSEACTPDVKPCVAECRAGEANACYAAALRLQELKFDEGIIQALFLRACRLGEPSGCTNHAAGLRLRAATDEHLQCATRTFEKSCAYADPWGCVMFGRALSAGEGTKPDLPRALEVLPKGCALRPRDPACTAAQALIRKIEEDLGMAPSAPLPGSEWLR